MNLFLTY